MGCSIIRCSSSSYEKTPIGNPNPTNYKILQSIPIDNFLILVVKYPDALNYEGKKVLLFENVTLEELQTQSKIDPHFFPNKYSPIARFVPTERGIDLATELCLLLKRTQA